jgi:hypothetical protein
MGIHSMEPLSLRLRKSMSRKKIWNTQETDEKKKKCFFGKHYLNLRRTRNDFSENSTSLAGLEPSTVPVNSFLLTLLNPTSVLRLWFR